MPNLSGLLLSNIKSLVSEAAQFSLDSSEPEVSELYKNIYATNS